MSSLNRLHETYGEQVQFFVVYIKEAHAANSRWPDRSLDVFEPTTLSERLDVAGTCSAKLNLKLPMLIDGMENSTERAYDSWPDRLFLVGKDGTLVYKGGHGPWGFKTADLEQAILQELQRETAPAQDARWF